MQSVYLAGPITGLTYGGCVDWREHAIKELARDNIQGISPMRAKEFLKNHVTIEDTPDLEDQVLSSQRGIYARDKFDCHRADLLIVNMLDAKKVSIGTVMEIAWAAAINTPIVLVMEEIGNIHQHMMLAEACPFRVTNLRDALRVTVAILAPQQMIQHG
jgi:nucleoside 2-deoxyribosyltransferase